MSIRYQFEPGSSVPPLARRHQQRRQPPPRPPERSSRHQAPVQFLKLPFPSPIKNASHRSVPLSRRVDKRIVTFGRSPVTKRDKRSKAATVTVHGGRGTEKGRHGIV